MTKDRTVSVSVADLQHLLDVVEGYLCENGPESAGKYAEPRQIEQAVNNTRAALREREE